MLTLLESCMFLSQCFCILLTHFILQVTAPTVCLWSTASHKVEKTLRFSLTVNNFDLSVSSTGLVNKENRLAGWLSLV